MFDKANRWVGGPVVETCEACGEEFTTWSDGPGDLRGCQELVADQLERHELCEHDETSES